MKITSANLGKKVQHTILGIWSKEFNCQTDMLINGEIIGQLFRIGENSAPYGYRCKFIDAPNKYFEEIVFIDYSLPETKNLIGTPIEQLTIIN